MREREERARQEERNRIRREQEDAKEKARFEADREKQRMAQEQYNADRKANDDKVRLESEERWQALKRTLGWNAENSDSFKGEDFPDVIVIWQKVGVFKKTK